MCETCGSVTVGFVEDVFAEEQKQLEHIGGTWTDADEMMKLDD